MKFTDYVMDFLGQKGVKHVFGLTGGAAVHFFDSVHKNPIMTPIFTHHEQAAAFAAQAYSRVTENLGVCVVTTGPGGTNALTGLVAAWLDSIPCVYISGQTRLVHTARNKSVRQIGTQELDIISIVDPVTKYSVMLESPEDIRYELEKAVYLATTGRPGPVWLDIPLNFHWMDINPDELRGFIPDEFEDNKNECTMPIASLNQVHQVIDLLQQSKRPLLLLGHGVRLAKAGDDFEKLLDVLGIPFVSSWLGSDIIASNHPLNTGRIGIAGQRGANLAIQNCDLLIAIGSHLSVPLTGTNYDFFAREAKTVVVDIDAVELENPTVKVDYPIHSDAKAFLQMLVSELNRIKSIQNIDSNFCFDDFLTQINSWISTCTKYVGYNSNQHEKIQEEGFVDVYSFLNALSNQLTQDDVTVVDGGGTVVYSSFQSLQLLKNQRLVLSTSLCSMGSGLPESVGACFANEGKRTICLCGDGSMQLNIQELQTIVHHNLPIKIFIIDNQGYLSIRQTQDGFLDRRYIGSFEDGGMTLPDYSKVLLAYGVPCKTISSEDDFELISEVLSTPGPMACIVKVSPVQEIAPRSGFKKNDDGSFSARPLEDMYPHLDREEFKKNMFVDILPVCKD